MATFQLRVRGHSLVKRRRKVGPGKYEQYDDLRVDFESIGDETSASATIYVEPGQAHLYPIGDEAEMAPKVKQLRLGLNDAHATETAPPATNGRKRGGGRKAGVTRGASAGVQAH